MPFINVWTRYAKIASYAAGFLLFVLLLELMAIIYGTPHVFRVLMRFLQLLSEGDFWLDLRVTFLRWQIGWLAGAIIGTMIGFLTGRCFLARFGLEGFMILARGVPYITLLPLAVRLFGLSLTAKVFLIAWAAATVCWVSIHEAALALPKELAWRAMTLHVPRRKWWLGIVLPRCSAGIRTGLRTSLLLALLVTAVAELGGVYERSSGLWWSGGIGHRLFSAGKNSEDAEMLALILVFAILAIFAEAAFRSIWLVAGAMRLRILRYQVHRADIAYAGKVGLVVDVGKEASPLFVNGLSARYTEKDVFRNLSFDLLAKETLSVVGQSGSGKSTLIRIVAGCYGQELSVDGSVTIGKADDIPNIGILFQDAEIFEGTTVWHNLLFAGSMNRSDVRDANRAYAWWLLEKFELKGCVSQLAETLSGGQKQRLALATVLANRPNLLLLDEPFGKVDALTRLKLQDFYLEQVRGLTTAILVTHDVDEAIRLGNCILVGVGSPETCLIRPCLKDLTEAEEMLEYKRLRQLLLSSLSSSTCS